MGSSTSRPRTASKAAKERREAEEAENTQRVDELPQELWEKIFDHLDENDFFPMALSCRFLRLPLVARTRQNGTHSRLPRRVLKTNLKRKLENGQPVSADYLRFCSKEEGSGDELGGKIADYVRRLAAYHGHLPLLQELIERLRVGDLRKGGLGKAIAENAGESSLPLFLCSFFWF